MDRHSNASQYRTPSSTEHNTLATREASLTEGGLTNTNSGALRVLDGLRRRPPFACDEPAAGGREGRLGR